MQSVSTKTGFLNCVNPLSQYPYLRHSEPLTM